jgi:hypothetical protein
MRRPSSETGIVAAAAALLVAFGAHAANVPPVERYAVAPPVPPDIRSTFEPMGPLPPRSIDTWTPTWTLPPEWCGTPNEETGLRLRSGVPIDGAVRRAAGRVRFDGGVRVEPKRPPGVPPPPPPPPSPEPTPTK